MACLSPPVFSSPGQINRGASSRLAEAAPFPLGPKPALAVGIAHRSCFRLNHPFNYVKVDPGKSTRHTESGPHDPSTCVHFSWQTASIHRMAVATPLGTANNNYLEPDLQKLFNPAFLRPQPHPIQCGTKRLVFPVIGPESSRTPSPHACPSTIQLPASMWLPPKTGSGQSCW